MSGPVYLITGASSGIGEATAHRLAREPDATLVLVARREDRLRALAGAVGAPATYVAADLVDPEAPARVRAHLEAEHGGRLDLLVNNAGAAWRSTFADGGYENVRRTMEINFDAQLRLTEALLPLLRASAPSAIVNVASTAGRVVALAHRRLQRLEGRAGGLVGRAARGGGRQRRARRARAPGLHLDRGLPAGRADVQAVDALAGLDAREGRRGDPPRRPRREVRALRAARLRDLRGASGSSRPGSCAASSTDRARR